MIMLNLFTGVIITSMEEAQVERAEEVREEHLKEKGFLTLHDELSLLSNATEQDHGTNQGSGEARKRLASARRRRLRPSCERV